MHVKLNVIMLYIGSMQHLWSYGTMVL